jgi:D-lactate dehydrogenase (cytochrome)
MSEEYAQYLRDESQKTGTASLIAFPKTTEETAALLALCNQERLPVTVQGARTGIAAGCVPAGGLILNLSRMNRVLGCRRLESGSFAFRVQAGVILSEFAGAVESKRFSISGWDEDSVDACRMLMKGGDFFFSPDPTERSATLGGMAACNASGARSYKYGSVRPYIVALRAVLADGRPLSLRRGACFAQGRRLNVSLDDGGCIEATLPSYRMPDTKNTSGYYASPDMDAIDLLIGSDGTLAVITELEVTLLPQPGCIWGMLAFLPGREEALDYVLRLRAMDEGALASIEYFDAGALEILRRQRTGNAVFASLPEFSESAGAAVYTELHCEEAKEALALLGRAGEALEAAGGREEETLVARTRSDLLALQFFRHAIPESVNLLIAQRKKECAVITKLSTDMAVPDRHLAHMMEYYHDALDREGLQSAVWGHIGDNHLHINILPRNAAEYDKGRALYTLWAKEVCRLSGAVSAEHAVGKLKVDYLEIMYGKAHIDEMRALKKAFDPLCLLGRGNIFAGRGAM